MDIRVDCRDLNMINIITYMDCEIYFNFKESFVE